MRCPDCETVDDVLFDETTFWLHFPSEDGFAKAVSYIGGRALPAEPFGTKGVSVTVTRPDLDAFLTGLFGALSGAELAATNMATTPAGQALDANALGRFMTADVFINRYKSGWIVEAIRAERVTSWFQPILRADAPDAARPYAMEALMRLSDANGTIVPPAHVFRMARHSALLFALDLVARRSAVESAARAGLDCKVFVNFNPSSIYDPAYCLRTTAAAIQEIGLDPATIVFELTETHRAQDMAHLKGILAFYRAAGFGVAIDDIGSGWSGLNMLHEFRPDYVKVDMDLVRGVDGDAYKQPILRHLIEIARANGIKTIAEGIETQGEAAWLTDAGVDYLQGFLFAKPAPLEPNRDRAAASDRLDAASGIFDDALPAGLAGR